MLGEGGGRGMGGGGNTSFQIASVDAAGLLVVWTELEVARGGGHGAGNSDADLGLSVGGLIKVRSLLGLRRGSPRLAICISHVRPWWKGVCGCVAAWPVWDAKDARRLRQVLWYFVRRTLCRCADVSMCCVLCEPPEPPEPPEHARSKVQRAPTCDMHLESYNLV